MSFIVPLFYRLLYMSIVASVIGVTLILLKKIVGKEISAKYNYCMWAIFIVSLLFPAVIQSKMSLYNLVDLSSVQNLYMYPEEYTFRVDVDEDNNEADKVDKADKTDKAVETAKTNKPNKPNETDKTDKTAKSDETGFATETQLDAEMSNAEMSDAEIEETATTVRSEKVEIKRAIPYIWFGGLVLLLTFYFISYFVLQYKIGKEELADKRVKSILDKARADLKVKKDFKLVKQNYIKSPALMGIIQPKILVVDGIECFSDKNLEYIFRHELSHYKRKDNIVSTILAMAKIVYWFNPVVWLVIKEIRKDMELAADEIAVKTLNTSERKEYCKLLVYLSTIYNSGFVEKALGVADDKTNLEKRISMVKITDKISKHPVLSAFLVFIIIGLVCLILYTNNYYERELQEPPILYVRTEEGERKEMLLTRSFWIYKNQVHNVDIHFDENNYPFTEANTIIVPCFGSEITVEFHPKFKAKILHAYIDKLEDGSFESTYNVNSLNVENEYNTEIWQPNGIYVYKITVTDSKNNRADYAIRMVTVNGKDISSLQNLVNTKLSEKEKIEKLLNHITMSNYLEKYEVEDNTLKLSYQYYPGEKSLNGMATILFSYIDDLQNIEFSFTHHKFAKNEVLETEDYQTQLVNFEFMEPVLKTRDEVLQQEKEQSDILKGEY